MTCKLDFGDREIIVEVEQIQIAKIYWHAVVVDGDEREHIPDTTSDTKAIAEGLGILAMMKLGASIHPIIC